MQQRTQSPIYWSSPGAFVIAAAAAVIGLGNVWRLPYLAGEYGGGAFLLLYVLALISMVLPVLMAELLLGRAVRGNVVVCLRQWVRESALHPAWSVIGPLALVGAVLVLSYYSVISGWSLAYLLRSAAGLFAGADAQALRQTFVTLVGDPEKGLAWHTIFMVAATICVSHGVRRGLEPVTRWLLGAAFAGLALLLLMALSTGDLGAAAAYLLRPDFSALGWRGIVEAMTQAFFSLSLGAGVMIALGAYLRDETSLLKVGAAVVALDTLFSLTAGMVVIAFLMAANMQPASGLQLLFEVFPAAAAATGGSWAVILFFLILLMITLTTAMGLMEPVVVWIGERFGISRVFATTTAGLLIWFSGLATLLSFNLLADFSLLGRTVFDWLALLSSRVLLPLVGLLLCLLVGRFLLPARLLAAWSPVKPAAGFALWRWGLRYPARVGLILVMLYSVGVFTFMENLW